MVAQVKGRQKTTPDFDFEPIPTQLSLMYITRSVHNCAQSTYITFIISKRKDKWRGIHLSVTQVLVDQVTG
jgi:hypothetical protein